MLDSGGMDEPVISVVVPTFRRPETLPQAVASALQQEGVSVEVVVIDDDPQGSAEPVVQRLRDLRVRYLRMRETSGARPGRVRNAALESTRAPLLHFLDDDDRVAPGAYAALAAALEEHPRAALACGAVEAFGDDARAVEYERGYFARAARRLRFTERSRLRPLLLAALLYAEAPLITSAALFRRAPLLELQGFSDELPVFEDLDLFVRAVRRFETCFVDRTVLLHRVDARSLAHQTDIAAQAKAAYGAIHRAYRDAHGRLELLSLRLLARTALRLA